MIRPLSAYLPLLLLALPQPCLANESPIFYKEQTYGTAPNIADYFSKCTISPSGVLKKVVEIQGHQTTTYSKVPLPSNWAEIIERLAEAKIVESTGPNSGSSYRYLAYTDKAEEVILSEYDPPTLRENQAAETENLVLWLKQVCPN